MDFDPINNDHAVSVAVFSVALDGIIRTSVMQRLRSRADITAELPAVQTPDALAMPPGVPVPRPIRILQLSHLRPDGSSAWALRLAGNEIAVECTRYTRWERVWSAALRYLDASLELVLDSANERSKETKALVVSLNVVDTFIAKRQDYNLHSLLRPGELIAGKAFESGALWHSHAGWFEATDEPNLSWLNLINVDARRTRGPSSEDYRVEIAHVQEHRFNAALKLADLRENLDERMRTLHLHNKKLLSSLLAPQMAARVGLAESQENVASRK